MFNLDAFKLNSCRAATFGALAIGTIAFSGAAAATPLQLFPFIMTPAPQSTTPSVQSAPSGDEGTVAEMPARLRRQIVSYATREAPGTVIIDTPNTYLYYVLGGGQAIRYGSASAATASPGRACSRSPRRPSGRIGPRPRK
jgi:lipoprotein-anchoring transpeptidase ErfK/SrfK